ACGAGRRRGMVVTALRRTVSGDFGCACDFCRRSPDDSQSVRGDKLATPHVKALVEKPDVARKRIYMSVPHMSGREEIYIAEAFRSNWLSSVGPHIDAFEREVAEQLGAGV